MKSIRSILQRTSKFFQTHSNVIVLLLFIVIILIGCVRIPTYGVSWDEELEINTLGSNIKSYSNLLKSDITYWDNFIPIKENIERDHGNAIYYPTAVTKNIFDDLYGRRALLVRHYYTFAFYILSVFCIYLLIKNLTKRKLYAILGVIFMAISPRIFVQSFYNCKDIMLMSLIGICMYLSYKFISQKKFLWAILFGVACAFAANLRIIGFFIFGIMGLFYLIDYIYLCIKDKKFNIKGLLCGLCCIVVFALVYYAVTPACWGNLKEYFDYTFNQSMDFVRWDGFVLFNNELYKNTLNPLPWYYIPSFIAITTPVIITLLCVFGIIITIIKSISKQILTSERKYYLSYLIFLLLPMIIAIAKKSNIYNGWRHFYFIYPAMVVLAILSVKTIVEFKRKILTNVVKGAIIVDVIAVIVLCCINPYTMHSYYNPMVYVTDKAASFEHDYWNLSATQCLIELADEYDGDDKINITAYDWASSDGLMKAYNFLPEKYSDRFNLYRINTIGNVDNYYVLQNTTYSDMFSKEYDEKIIPYKDFEVKDGEVVVEMKSFDYSIMKIYKCNKK